MNLRSVQEWYYLDSGKNAFGPCNLDELKSRLLQGLIKADTILFHPELPNRFITLNQLLEAPADATSLLMDALSAARKRNLHNPTHPSSTKPEPTHSSSLAHSYAIFVKRGAYLLTFSFISLVLAWGVWSAFHNQEKSTSDKSAVLEPSTHISEKKEGSAISNHSPNLIDARIKNSNPSASSNSSSSDRAPAAGSAQTETPSTPPRSESETNLAEANPLTQVVSEHSDSSTQNPEPMNAVDSPPPPPADTNPPPAGDNNPPSEAPPPQ